MYVDTNEYTQWTYILLFWKYDVFWILYVFLYDEYINKTVSSIDGELYDNANSSWRYDSVSCIVVGCRWN